MTKYDKKGSGRFGFTRVVQDWSAQVITLFSPVFTRVCCVFPKLEKIRPLDSIPVRATNLRLPEPLGLAQPCISRSLPTDREVSTRRREVDWNQGKVLRAETARCPMAGYTALGGTGRFTVGRSSGSDLSELAQAGGMIHEGVLLHLGERDFPAS